MARVCRTGLALVGAMLGLAPIALVSQPIYRCGNSYSQTPCANGIVVRADDLRTPDQKAQTDAAIVQAARMAERMERDRLDSENTPAHATNRPARIGSGHPSTTKQAASRQASSEPGTRKQSSARKRTMAKAPSPPQAPDHFIATTRQDDKKKPAIAKPRD